MSRQEESQRLVDANVLPEPPAGHFWRLKVSIALMGLTVLQLRKKGRRGSSLVYDQVILDWTDENLYNAGSQIIDWYDTRERLNEQAVRLERLMRGEL